MSRGTKAILLSGGKTKTRMAHRVEPLPRDNDVTLEITANQVRSSVTAMRFDRTSDLMVSNNVIRDRAGRELGSVAEIA